MAEEQPAFWQVPARRSDAWREACCG